MELKTIIVYYLTERNDESVNIRLILTNKQCLFIYYYPLR